MRPFRLVLPTRAWPPWLRYFLTFVLFGIALLLESVWLDAAKYPFLFFLCAIIISAALLDRGSSLLGTGLAAGTLALFALRPNYAFAPQGAPDWVAWGIFVFVALTTGALVELLHKAIDELRLVNAALAASEQEKDLLLRESAHRTRNDLARLSGLIHLEIQSAKDDPRLQDRLRRISDRIQVFSRLQNRLSRKNEAAVVEMQDYISDLCRDLHSSLVGVRPITVEARAEARPLAEPSAVVVGLIVNELVTNALKHAFPEERPGRVEVTFVAREAECMICVEDDGIGLPKKPVPRTDGQGLGQKLIGSLVDQLQGSYVVRPRRDGSGTVASVRFPLN